MVSGTDEHGTPVMVAADAAGESPRDTAERFNRLIREDLHALGLSYDLFTRTTTANHYRVTRDLFRTLYENGYIFEQETLGAFSASTGHTLPDRYIEGTCPICGFDGARGDQCDNCGNQLDPVDLIDPRSKIDGAPPVFEKTKHLFLDLPAFKEQLTAWIASKDEWRQNVKRFSLNFVAELKPRAITRDLDWGVPIPVPGLRRARGQADLRLVRRRHRLPLGLDRVGGESRHARRLARVVAEPVRRARVLHGEGQHRLPHRHLAEHPPRLRRGWRDRCGTRRARAPRQRRLQRVPDDGGAEVQLEPRGRDPRTRLPQPLRPGRPPLLPLHRRPGDAGHRLHVVGVRAAQQRRARGDVGQPRQPDAPERVQDTSARFRSPGR